jgi:DNA-binding response OmpR family regulator
MILESEGYSVDLLPEGKKVFDHIDNFHPDLIILDVMLGEVDGRDLCSQIKKAKDTTHIPIIMISATHNMKEIIFEKCKPDDYLSKPFDINTLINKVQTNLSA